MKAKFLRLLTPSICSSIFKKQSRLLPLKRFCLIIGLLTSYFLTSVLAQTDKSPIPESVWQHAEKKSLSQKSPLDDKKRYSTKKRPKKYKTNSDLPLSATQLLTKKGEEAIQAMQFNEAILAFEQAIALDPENDNVWMHLAEVRYQQKEYSQALYLANKAQNIASTFSVIQRSQQMITAVNAQLILESERQKALPDLSSLYTALNYDPSNPDIYYEIASTYLKNGEFKQAEHFAKMLSELNNSPLVIVKSIQLIEDIKDAQHRFKPVQDQLINATEKFRKNQPEEAIIILETALSLANELQRETFDTEIAADDTENDIDNNHLQSRLSTSNKSSLLDVINVDIPQIDTPDNVSSSSVSTHVKTNE